MKEKYKKILIPLGWLLVLIALVFVIKTINSKDEGVVKKVPPERIAMQLIEEIIPEPYLTVDSAEYGIVGPFPQGTQIWINDEEQSANENGMLFYKTILEKGENKFVFVIRDKAGKEAKKTLSIIYAEPQPDILADDVDVENINNSTDKVVSLFKANADCPAEPFDDAFICILNEYRQSQGLGIVNKSAGLKLTAQKHTDWMEENNKLSHLGNNNSTFTQRCQATGITCAAENVGYGFLSPQHLLELWQNSPSHNEILLGDYTRVGVGFTDKYATLLLDF